MPPTQSMPEEETGNNKKLIILIVVLVLIIIGGLVYFLAAGDLTIDRENDEDVEDVEEVEEQTEIDMTREPHLFLAGTGGELGARNENQAVSEFDPGDYLGVSGQYEVREEGRMWGNLLDRNEGMITEEALPPFTAHVTEGPGGFSMCCAAVPNRANSYHIEVVLDGQRMDLLPFEVVEGEDQVEVEEPEEVEEEEEDVEDEEE